MCLLVWVRADAQLLQEWSPASSVVVRMTKSGKKSPTRLEVVPATYLTGCAAPSSHGARPSYACHAVFIVRCAQVEAREGQPRARGAPGREARRGSHLDGPSKAPCPCHERGKHRRCNGNVHCEGKRRVGVNKEKEGERAREREASSHSGALCARSHVRSGALCGPALSDRSHVRHLGSASGQAGREGSREGRRREAAA